MIVDFKSKKFLVIDDLHEFRSAIRSMLRSFGVLSIDNANSGESAIDMIENNTYDAILCDYNLGFDRMDGQQVLEQIKHRELVKISTIYIMISAQNQTEMVMGVVEYYPDDYLMKPLTKDVLLTRLEKAFRKKKDFELIETAVQRKEFRYALELCEEQLTQTPPNLFEYIKLKGELLLQIGDYSQAKALYEEVLSIREIPWAKIGLGRAFFHQEAYPEARDIFGSIIFENKMNVVAYDWLTKTLLKLNSFEEAQNVLLNSVTISPKSVNRQKQLGEVAFQNKAFDVSQRAFKAAIELGRYSCYKTPTVYTGLSKVLVNKNEPKEALSVLNNIHQAFQGSPEALFQAAAMKGVVYQTMNKTEKAKKCFLEVSELLKTTGKNIPKEILLDLAKSCLDVGEKETSLQLFKDIIRNNHDDKVLLQEIQTIFSGANLSEEGKRLITAIRNETAQINNQGVALVESGNITEAIECFEEAVQVLSKNKIIIANTVQTMLLFVEKKGGDPSLLLRAKGYLNRLQEIDPEYRKIPILQEKYEILSRTLNQEVWNQSFSVSVNKQA